MLTGMSSWLKTDDTLDLNEPSLDFGTLVSDFSEIPP